MKKYETIKAKFIDGMTTKHTAKMENMVSFSTNTMSNPFCEAMRKCEGSICSKCFATTMHKRLPSFSEKINKNEWIKTERMTIGDVPFLNVAYFRFEAFGELETMLQLENYMLIALLNPHVNFALWTKRTDLLKNKFQKPKNVNIIVSSPMMNTQMVLSEDIESKVDGIFTVYDKKGSEGVKINCGDKKCIECLICYKKSKKMKIVNELVK